MRLNVHGALHQKWAYSEHAFNLRKSSLYITAMGDKLNTLL